MHVRPGKLDGDSKWWGETAVVDTPLVVFLSPPPIILRVGFELYDIHI